MHAQLTRCAVSNTVVGTVASASFLPGLMTLADSSAAVGFACVVVQPFDWFDELKHERLEPLPVPSPTLVPRKVWCDTALRHQYGWRRSHLYRVRLWRVVLETGLNLLAADLDHMMGPISPMAFLSTVYAPAETHSQLKIPTSSRVAEPADVVAVWDGPGSRYLNVGIMWMRSTSGTIELARRAENRSFSAWEQQIFNEELNFNEDLAGVRCCHTICLKHLIATSNATRRLPTKSLTGTTMRQKVEGEDKCRDDGQPTAAYPPRGSLEPWADHWTPNADVLRSRHTSNRKYGRCNHDANFCVMVDAASGAVSHIASTHGATLAGMSVPPSMCKVPESSVGK